MKRIISVLAACAAAIATNVQAAYPDRPITLVVPFPAGATTDTVARVVSQAASIELGQPIVVDNKPGAEGQVAAQDVVRAAPDGYRLLLGTSGNLSLVPALRKKPPYDVLTDFTPVADVGRFSFFLYVHPSVPAKTLKEFLDYAKANPGKMSYGTGNNTGVVAFSHFNTLNGLDLTHVPYKGEPPAMLDLIAGRTQAMIGTTIGAPYMRDGKLRALVTINAQRNSLLADVPTLRESGMRDLEIVPWAGLVGPAGLPRDVVTRLNKAFVAALNKPEVRAQMDRLGFPLTPSTPEAFGRMMKEQLAIHARLVKSAGLQPD
ncbi:tripartite tricarboxylate transporter substrate binding protein [Imbroritus primus]|jgi:tripartite-type tricarboxylate transporter receptor subunit TctC|uniref:Tripartite tricarboxylate transporter substrate binding protein n=1 Tax=Imbroritus primus TaxID=3058603 RepID=A0ACD3SP50_9BURK|nr:tripartite tricarboxylate transporter substrate binding protein [Burkholderiaceae bacterium PBA]